MTIRETSACPFCGQAHSGTACNHALDSLDMEDHGHLINEATGEIGKLQSEINRQIRKLHSSILWSPKSSKHGTR